MGLFSFLKSAFIFLLFFTAAGALFSLFLLGAYSLGGWPLAIYAGYGVLVSYDVNNMDHFHKPISLTTRPVLGRLFLFILWPIYVISLGMYRRFLLYPVGLAVPFLFLYLIVS